MVSQQYLSKINLGWGKTHRMKDECILSEEFRKFPPEEVLAVLPSGLVAGDVFRLSQLGR